MQSNSKHTINQSVRHLLHIELGIKSCLENTLKKIYSSKDNYKYLKPCGSKLGIIYRLCKIPKGTTVNDAVAIFDLFYEELVLVTKTLQNVLYQYLKSLLLMNTLSKIIFHFLKKFLTKTQTHL